MNIQSWIVLMLFLSLMGYILFRQIRLIASGKKKCNACTVKICPMYEAVPAEEKSECIAGNAMMAQMGIAKGTEPAEKYCPTSQIIKD